MAEAFSFQAQRFPPAFFRTALACVVVAQATSLAAFDEDVRDDGRHQRKSFSKAPSVTEESRRERPDAPAPRTVEQPWMSLAEWRERHARQLADPCRADARIAFLGDSITQAWGESEPFRAAFDRYTPLSLGIGGDQTQHLLWRIERGALDGLKPRMLVVLIGVNNLANDHSPEETATGVGAVIAAARTRLPSAKILLLSILPAGEKADDPLRQGIMRANQKLRTLEDPARVALLDAGAALIEPDGSIAASTMADFLHPTPEGYVRFTNAVAPLVDEIMSQ
ncbi:MAG: hypothetical protein JXO72_02275 [Vicinamibacteria bacterium]|nr:hypothetical protein [Vicinamibacteria bacterium]